MGRCFSVSRAGCSKWLLLTAAVGIMFMLYLFLYSWFDPEEEITERRALAWQALHLPLHLGILLLLAAMVVSRVDCGQEMRAEAARPRRYRRSHPYLIVTNGRTP